MSPAFPVMIAPRRCCIDQKLLRSAVLALLFLAAHEAPAGTWTIRQWKSDGDLPQPAPEKVTHAIAFGIDAEPPVPAPFARTNKISGEKWSVWKYPEHKPAVIVDRRPESLLNSIKVGEESFCLLQGRILPKGKSGGLSLEISGLEPGRNYSLALFGPGFATVGGSLLKVIASDAPDQPEELKASPTGAKAFFVYDYTAPSNGQLTVSFESDASNKGPQIVRFCAFFNYHED